MAEVVFDDIKVPWPLGEYKFTVSPEFIRSYAEAVQDDNPLFTREEAARASVFGRVAAPPLSIDVMRPLKALLPGIPDGGLHAREEVEFLFPALSGDEVTVSISVIEKYVRKNNRYVVFEHVCRNQEGRLLLRAKKTLTWSK